MWFGVRGEGKGKVKRTIQLKGWCGRGVVWLGFRGLLEVRRELLGPLGGFTGVGGGGGWEEVLEVGSNTTVAKGAAFFERESTLSINAGNGSLPFFST